MVTTSGRAQLSRKNINLVGMKPTEDSHSQGAFGGQWRKVSLVSAAVNAPGVRCGGERRLLL